jgi:hypothetical protein
MPEFQIAPVLQTMKFQRDFFTERLRKKSATSSQQETPTTGHQTPSAVTPYVNMGKMPEFQIAPVLKPSNISTRFLH